jgi:hypothetical protein
MRIGSESGAAAIATMGVQACNVPCVTKWVKTPEESVNVLNAEREVSGGLFAQCEPPPALDCYALRRENKRAKRQIRDVGESV